MRAATQGGKSSAASLSRLYLCFCHARGGPAPASSRIPQGVHSTNGHTIVTALNVKSAVLESAINYNRNEIRHKQLVCMILSYLHRHLLYKHGSPGVRM